MAGNGPPPKAPATRARRNATPGSAQLPAGSRAPAVPELPTIGRRRWHPQTIVWWEDVWKDPMSAEFANSDKHGLFMLAELVNAFWKLTATNPLRPKLATEIRMQGQRFGLSPLDRRRLQWEIERGADAEDRTSHRAAQRTANRRKPGDDPRAHLKVQK